MLGGNPLGFYEQPAAVQLDLLAYREVMLDPENDWWIQSLAPSARRDLPVYLAKSSILDVISDVGRTMSGLRSVMSLKRFGGVRWRRRGAGGPSPALAAAQSKSTPEALDFWRKQGLGA